MSYRWPHWASPTCFWAPSPRRCADCGVYEPLTALVRRGARGDYPLIDLVNYSHDNAVCADPSDCARRFHHRVGGPRP